MSKKILILSGSPRANGNSDILCDQFMAGAKESGNIVEKIRLQESEINYCLGCEHCSSHNGICAHNDDMAKILEKMIAADVIVMATPVYFYSMNAQIKTLIDRTVARYTEICNKEFYIILSAAVSDVSLMDRTVEGFRGFFDCLADAKECGVVYGVGAWKKGEIKASNSMFNAYEFGKNA